MNGNKHNPKGGYYINQPEEPKEPEDDKSLSEKIISAFGLIFMFVAIIGGIILIMQSGLNFWARVTFIAIIGFFLAASLIKAIDAKRYEKLNAEHERRLEEINRNRRKPFQERVDELLKKKEQES